MQVLEFGQLFIYCGGSFELTPKTLRKAIAIMERELLRDRKRLALWRRNPQHSSFEHDMTYHGARCINDLLEAHVRHDETKLEQLTALKAGGQQLLEL